MKRTRSVLALAMLMVLAACSAPATLELQPRNAAHEAYLKPEHVLVTVLTELQNHFATHGEGPTQVISEDATVQVAAEELSDALDLGPQARDFTIAAGFEVQRQAASASTVAATVSVSAEVSDDQAFSSGGGDVYLITVREEIRRDSGPTSESETQYAVRWDDRVDAIEAVTGTALLTLDNGVDLTTPRGAVRRYLSLVEDRDHDAIRRMSDAANANVTALDVLRSLVMAADDYRTVTLPQMQTGSSSTVYVVTSAGTPIARFDVTLGSLIPTVVYYPTV